MPKNTPISGNDLARKLAKTATAILKLRLGDKKSGMLTGICMNFASATMIVGGTEN